MRLLDRWQLSDFGRIASETQDRMLQGAKPGSSGVPMLTKVPPKEVIVRQSTSTFACDHPGVTAAAIFVRRHFHHPISVAEVATHAGMAVHTPQMRFTTRVGCAVKEDIERARLLERGYGSLYRIAAHLLAENGRVLDFGPVVLRLDNSRAAAK
jgi:hypothetical protein